jgi:hypothetical protein
VWSVCDACCAQRAVGAACRVEVEVEEDRSLVLTGPAVSALVVFAVILLLLLLLLLAGLVVVAVSAVVVLLLPLLLMRLAAAGPRASLIGSGSGWRRCRRCRCPASCWPTT